MSAMPRKAIGNQLIGSRSWRLLYKDFSVINMETTVWSYPAVLGHVLAVALMAGLEVNMMEFLLSSFSWSCLISLEHCGPHWSGLHNLLNVRQKNVTLSLYNGKNHASKTKQSTEQGQRRKSSNNLIPKWNNTPTQECKILIYSSWAWSASRDTALVNAPCTNPVVLPVLTSCWPFVISLWPQLHHLAWVPIPSFCRACWWATSDLSLTSILGDGTCPSSDLCFDTCCTAKNNCWF